MMRAHKSAVLVLGLVAATSVVAEQRFYQVMDAQGHIQTVTLPESPEKKEKKEGVPASGGHDQVHSVSPSTEPDGTAKPVDGGTTAAPSDQAAEADDQEYLDSEELERSNFNPEKKKRFYFINDGVGTRIEESEGPREGDNPGATPIFMAPKEPEQYVKQLQANPIDRQSAVELLAVVNGGLKNRSETGSLCIGASAIRKAQLLAPESTVSALIDGKARHFLGTGGVLSIISVAGDGLRAVAVQSVSRSDQKPGFVEPVFAYADKAGCIVRATISGYFEYWLPATNSRHPLLEGRLTMLSGERFLLVLLPDPFRTASPDFPSSPDGVVAVKWQK